MSGFVLFFLACGGAIGTLVLCAVLAACGVDGFHGDRSRPVPVPAASPVPAPRPALHTAAEGPLRVTARRLDQIEAA